MIGMTNSWYNGYNWKQRIAISRALQRGEAGSASPFAGLPCGLCGDPDRADAQWHSEDYSEPFLFEAPATYPVCHACHGRIHKRFNRPAAEWELFCRHIEAGGYGLEFTRLYPPRKRTAMSQAIVRGEAVTLTSPRAFRARPAWWRGLTLDPASLMAPWARPRPLRPRPPVPAYRAAIAAARLTEKEAAILRFHAAAPRRSVTMRMVAEEILGTGAPRTANLAYGGLAKRICSHLDWEPDTHRGRPFWLSTLTEGWWPPSQTGERREYELVLVPPLVKLFDGGGGLADVTADGTGRAATPALVP